MPLSKMDPKQHSGLPSPTVRYQHVAKGRLSYSSLSVSSGSAELLRGTALKNHLLQQKAGMYSHRSPAATARTDGTCSAYSSPQIPKKEVLRSKDTLDLRTSTLTQKALRDLQLRRNVNKNWTFGKYRLRSVDNADQDAACRLSANAQQGQGRARLLYNKGANGNEISGVSSGGTGNFQKEIRNISYRELGASEVEASSDKSKSFYQSFNMPRRGSEPGKVNMAAVAPFRFRFQVHENTDASLDELSDCSSDSMELCCDDIALQLFTPELLPTHKKSLILFGTTCYVHQDFLKYFTSSLWENSFLADSTSPNSHISVNAALFLKSFVSLVCYCDYIDMIDVSAV